MIRSVIVVAGGSGERFQSKIPKQFVKLSDKCVVMHSLQAFYEALQGMKIILALPEEFFDLWKELCDQYKFSIPHILSKGGETRFHSVRNALEFIGDNGIVAVHDGVRPLVSKQLIKNSFSHAERFGNAIPAIPVNDSVRMLENDHYKTINRDDIKIIQTPQCFETSLIKRAYLQPYNKAFTDDASVVEFFGGKIHIIQGDNNNLKITRYVDLLVAEQLLKQ